MNCLKIAVAGCIGGIIGNLFFLLIKNRIRPRSNVVLPVSSPDTRSSVTPVSSQLEGANDGEICHMRQLLEAFHAMRMKDSFTPDVTIICESRQFKAHKEILTAVNPFFQAALCRSWKEKVSNHVDLPCVSAESMEIILGFIYSRNVKSIPYDEEALLKLLMDSDFLQMDELVKVCFQKLSTYHLNSSNFHEMFEFFEGLNNTYCISEVIYYLAENFDHFANTQDFLLLKFQYLTYIIRAVNLNHYSLDDIITPILRWTEYEEGRVVFLSDFLSIFQYCCSECLISVIKKNMSLHWKCGIFDWLFRCYTNQEHKYKLHENSLLWIARPGGRDRHVFGLYSLNSSSWVIKTQDLPMKLKWGRSMAVHKRHIYFLGCGDEDEENAESTEVIQYCPLTNAVVSTHKESLIVPVWFAGAGVLGESIYVVNGLDINQNGINIVQRFNTKYGTCQVVASTHQAHQSPCVLPFNNSYLFALGQCGEEDEERFVERYDQETDQWTILTQVPGFSDTFSAAIASEGLFILKADELSQFLEYNIASNDWTVREFNRKHMFCLGKSMVRRNGKSVLYGIDCKYVHFYDIESGKWETQPYDHKYRRKIFHFTCV